MLATARAFVAAPANNGNMTGMAITHSDDLNTWLYGVKQGLINKMRYFVIPEDDKVAKFHTSRQLQCIVNGLQGLAIGGGMAENSDAVLLKLTTAISTQNKAATESNNLPHNEIHCQLMKDKSKKDQTMKIHQIISKMVACSSSCNIE
jgi:hypothetical protein